MSDNKDFMNYKDCLNTDLEKMMRETVSQIKEHNIFSNVDDVILDECINDFKESLPDRIDIPKIENGKDEIDSIIKSFWGMVKVYRPGEITHDGIKLDPVDIFEDIEVMKTVTMPVLIRYVRKYFYNRQGDKYLEDENYIKFLVNTLYSLVEYFYKVYIIENAK